MLLFQMHVISNPSSELNLCGISCERSCLRVKSHTSLWNSAYIYLIHSQPLHFKNPYRNFILISNLFIFFNLTDNCAALLGCFENLVSNLTAHSPHVVISVITRCRLVKSVHVIIELVITICRLFFFFSWEIRLYHQSPKDEFWHW